ncbi:MAG: hypothetical protein GF333_05090 [Candidatus Omnitrophica bacterium]|nr:hypothetical protein [Candidatus Omnitrophota bacterium]
MGFFGLSKSERAVWSRISPGEKLRITLAGNPVESYPSEIVSVKSSEISIQTPVKKTSFVELPKNAEVDVDLFTPDFGKISFRTRVREQNWSGKKVTKLACPRTLQRTQMRAYYRLDIIRDVEYIIAEGKGAKKNTGKRPVFFGLTRDISEGGIQLIGNKGVPAGTFLWLKIKLSERYSVRGLGQVLRAGRTQNQSKYSLGIKFVKMEQEDKEILRRFIFSKGRESFQGRNR